MDWNANFTGHFDGVDPDVVNNVKDKLKELALVMPNGMAFYHDGSDSPAVNLRDDENHQPGAEW
jgi:hypothetical protein